MIDPHDVTKFNRTDAQLEEFLLFCVCAAGKTASIISRQLENFLFNSSESTDSPFETIRIMARSGTLRVNLERAKLGKYGLLVRSFYQLAHANINLRICSTQQLEAFPGIGMKTSRFFIVHTRPKQNYAILDTHVIKWLGSIGYEMPKYIAKEYLKIEKHFLAEAQARKMPVAELDLKIWSASSNKTPLINVIPHATQRLVF
jgi:thermostable 8-oxoguanine DNA glycosylase